MLLFAVHDNLVVAIFSTPKKVFFLKTTIKKGRPLDGHPKKNPQNEATATAINSNNPSVYVSGISRYSLGRRAKVWQTLICSSVNFAI